MSALSRPSLSWIDVDTVIDVAAKRFAKAAASAASEDGSTRVEPTLAIVRSALTGVALADSNDLDIAVSLTKTIQNAVGLFHQDVLGSVRGWETTGSAGGVVDLKGLSPVLSDGTNRLVAELKMRFNTIKASDEKDTWDKLDAAVKVSGAARGYLFQIVPRTNEPYDRPWVVSGRVPNERVRAADGVTAYHLVTGVPDALHQLMRAMPYVMTQVVSQIRGDSSHLDLQFSGEAPLVQEIVEGSLPATSAHD